MEVARCESLEKRSLLAATLGPGGTLTVHGTSAADSIGIRVVTTELRVDINGTLSKFSLASVNFITIDLFEGNDRLDLADVPVNIYCLGGLGDDSINASLGNDTITAGGGKDSVYASDGADTVTGGLGHDSLEGGNGTDSLDGNDGDDTVSGGFGRDQVIGGNGIDALLGGRDEDTLRGNDGADRFLLRPNDVSPDQTPIDGRVLFKDGTVSWEDSEILLLDAGLKWLQQRTGSTKMMRMSNGEEFEVVRYGSLSGGDTLADNDSEGTIRVATNTFDYGDTDIAATMIHEIAHNWDKEDENPGVEDNFYELSRWRKRFNVWTHDPDAEFAREYGETNPYEDFATCLEVYFDESNPARNWQSKWDYIDGFLDAMG